MEIISITSYSKFLLKRQCLAVKLQMVSRDGSWSKISCQERYLEIGSPSSSESNRNWQSNDLKKQIFWGWVTGKQKAYIIAQGFAQSSEVHFNQTFAHVARFGSIRILIAISVSFAMSVRLFGISSSNLSGDIEVEITMEPKYLMEVLDIIIRTERHGAPTKSNTDLWWFKKRR